MHPLILPSAYVQVAGNVHPACNADRGRKQLAELQPEQDKGSPSSGAAVVGIQLSKHLKGDGLLGPMNTSMSDRTSQKTLLKQKVIDKLIEHAAYGGVVLSQSYEYVFDNKKLIEIVRNKRDYSEFIEAIKATDDAIVIKEGKHAAAFLWMYVRSECREIIDAFGDEWDKMLVQMM
jgi:hypothetical protein